MAKNTVSSKRNSSKKNQQPQVEWHFPLEKLDLIWLAIGVAVVIVGHLLLATGMTEDPALPVATWNNVVAVNIAPIVLFIGYIVIIPMALFKFFSRRKAKKNANND
jgi:hypothetical protein